MIAVKLPRLEVEMTPPSLDQIPLDMNADTQLSMVMHLWKLLLAHDEIIGARNLLSAIPWKIRDRPEIAEMKRMTATMLTHVDDRDRMKEMYSNYGSEAIALTAEFPPEWSQNPRYNFALDTVKALCHGPKSEITVLDIACMEGWLSNRLGMKTRASVYGIDLSSVATQFARMRAEEFSTRARFATRHFGDQLPPGWPNQFDVVLLFEIYEHVDDTLSLVKKAAEHVAPGGTLLISTPRGSWCQGYQVTYHEKWNDEKPREHVRAPIASDVAADMIAAGLIDVAATEQSMPGPDVPEQATVLAKGKKPS